MSASHPKHGGEVAPLSSPTRELPPPFFFLLTRACVRIRLKHQRKSPAAA